MYLSKQSEDQRQRTFISHGSKLAEAAVVAAPIRKLCPANSLETNQLIRSPSFARNCTDGLGWDLVLRWNGVLAGGSVPSGNEKESLQCCYYSQGHALLENKNYAARCRV